MTTDAELIFADHAGRFYAREYGFPPVAGRLLGYLVICDPPQQTIADLAEALLASRSAITGAVKLLEGYRAVRRTRAAGERVDRVSIDPAGLEPKGFTAAIYEEQAALAREALVLLTDAPAARRAVVEEAAAFYDFLAKRLPAVLEEWRAHRDDLRAAENGRAHRPAAVPADRGAG
jgi:DNA-binding MarR family transcriptional regulator